MPIFLRPTALIGRSRAAVAFAPYPVAERNPYTRCNAGLQRGVRSPGHAASPCPRLISPERHELQSPRVGTPASPLHALQQAARWSAEVSAFLWPLDSSL